MVERGRYKKSTINHRQNPQALLLKQLIPQTHISRFYGKELQLSIHHI